MTRYCYIHIGTHKTGTTSIQAFLAANRKQLASRGLFVPVSGSNGDPEFACHHGVVRALLGYARSEAERGSIDAIATELRENDAARSCLSSEDFSLLYDRPELLVRLRDTIRASGFEPRIVVYARPQASYAVAIYAANVDSGFTVPFRTFLSDVYKRGCYLWDGGSGPPFDYVRLLENFAAVFGHEAVIVRRFRSGAADTVLLESFLHVILPHHATTIGLLVPEKRANRTLTFAGVLRRLEIQNQIDEHIRFAPLTPFSLVRLWLRFRAANRELAARYGTKVPTFELVDLIRTLPMRDSLGKTRQLLDARRALRSFVELKANDSDSSAVSVANTARTERNRSHVE